MTKKRYLAVAGILVGIVCLGALVPLVLPERPGVTKRKFDRIQDGMTKTDVEEMLGGTASEIDMLDDVDHETWLNSDGSGIYIQFNGGFVGSKEWIDSKIANNLDGMLFRLLLLFQ